MTGMHTDIFAVSDVATTIMESNDTTGNGIEMPKACLRHITAESTTHRAKLNLLDKDTAFTLCCIISSCATARRQVHKWRSGKPQTDQYMRGGLQVCPPPL